MTWREAKQAIAEKAVALIPIGSTEAHGPHLPLETDVIISLSMAKLAAKKLKTKGVRAIVAPALNYAVTDFAAEFPGTISISRDTALGLLRDVGLSLGRQGFKAICFANSHLEPEHIRVLREVAEEVSRKTGAAVCFPDKRRERWSATLTEEFRSGACHAGQYETSIVMAADPKLVHEDLRKDLKPNRNSISEKIKAGAKNFKDAGGPEAYFGDPAAASVAEGKSSLDALSDMLVTVVLEALSQGPLPGAAPHVSGKGGGNPA